MRRTLLRLVVLAAVVCAALAVLLPWEVARLIAAAPLAFVLPGYAIAAASFDKRLPEAPDLAVLTLGCSLTVLALGALVLNYVPGHIGTGSWAALLALVTVAAAVVGDRRGFASTAPWEGHRFRVPLVEAACILLAVLLAAGGVLLANKPLAADSAAGYTALWVTPPAGAGDDTVEIGVRSGESTTHRYRLKVQVGERAPYDLGVFGVEPGDTRLLEAPVLGRPPWPVRITALLFDQRAPAAIYRKVRVWLPERS